MPGRPILLVEDDDDDRTLAQRALRGRLSNELVLARDGQEALDWLFRPDGSRTANPLPVAMILDLGLPRVDGRQLLRRLALEPSCRTMAVVITTTSKDPDDRIDSYSMGAISYLVKPVDFEKLVAALRRPGYLWHLDHQDEGPVMQGAS